MVKLLHKYLIAFLLLVLNNCVFAYDPDTHRKLSEESIRNTGVSNDPIIIFNLGIESGVKFPNTNNNSKTILDLVSDGASFEDDSTRALNHFYDPLSGNGIPLGFGRKSPDWALEDKGEIIDVHDGVTDLQKFSYREARQYLFNGLTSTNKTNRDKYFGLTFQTIGQVIHHIQDMAQPQHSRLDVHCDNIICVPLLLYNPSGYEEYTKKVQGNLTYAGYPRVTLSKPRKYWTTQEGSQNGKGMADYSNRNFNSAGTIFATHKFPLPEREPATEYKKSVQELFTAAGIPAKIPVECTGIYPQLPGDCYMVFFANNVDDQLYPQLNGVNERSATYSVFDQDLIDRSEDKDEWWEDGILTLNRFNYDEAHKFLIQRAVGYSAGLIDYFFRGRMEISAPDEGIYGIVDHSSVNQKDVQGFAKIKLKIKNTTPPIVEGSDPVGYIQDMQAGRLVAVARFRRNICYEADLSGEFKDGLNTWNSCSRVDYRTPDEEYLVSQAVSGIELSADPAAAPTPMTFQFDTPIPINATDLYLQVVYRGSLGDESDAVVVSRVDLREPTYYNLVNGTDYFMVDGEFYSHDTINNNPALRERLGPLFDQTDALDLVNIKIRLVPENVVVAEIDHLPPLSYARVAYLADKDNLKLNYSYKAYYHQQYTAGSLVEAWSSDNATATVRSKVNQTASQYNDTVSPVSLARGVYYWHMTYLFQSNAYNWDGTLSPTDLEERIMELPELSDTNGIRVNILY
jgi:hypothetical protein